MNIEKHVMKMKYLKHFMTIPKFGIKSCNNYLDLFFPPIIKSESIH